MARNGSGTASLLAPLATANTVSSSTTVNATMDDIAEMLTDSINVDGTKAWEANQSIGGFKLTSLGAGTLAGDAAQLSQVQTGVVSHSSAVAGTADAIEVTFSPANTAWATNERIRWKSGGANTVVAPTISRDAGSTTKTIKKGAGAALAVGDTGASGYECEAVYNGTDVILLNPAGTVGSASTTVAGIVELATTTEQLTGTSASLAATPDSIAALWEAGADVADGAAITIGEGGYFNLITSTTAITSFSITTDKVGRTFRVRFNTARTLTHNATSLIIPGGSNVTTAQGDIAQIRSLGSGNVVVEWYTKADGTPLVASPNTGVTLLGTIDTSSGTSATLTSLVLTSYKMLSLVVNGLGADGDRTFLIGNSTSDDVTFTPTTGGDVPTLKGIVTIDLTTGIGSSVLVLSTGASSAIAFDSAITTATTTISIAPSSTNLDAGEIKVYGLK